jgi:hypothetical protein
MHSVMTQRRPSPGHRAPSTLVIRLHRTRSLSIFSHTRVNLYLHARIFFYHPRLCGIFAHDATCLAHIHTHSHTHTHTRTHTHTTLILMLTRWSFSRRGSNHSTTGQRQTAPTTPMAPTTQSLNTQMTRVVVMVQRVVTTAAEAANVATASARGGTRLARRRGQSTLTSRANTTRMRTRPLRVGQTGKSRAAHATLLGKTTEAADNKTQTRCRRSTLTGDRALCMQSRTRLTFRLCGTSRCTATATSTSQGDTWSSTLLRSKRFWTTSLGASAHRLVR